MVADPPVAAAPSGCGTAVACGNASRRRIVCSISASFTGLLSGTQPWPAIVRSVAAEMSPVRMITGIARFSVRRSRATSCRPFSPFGRA